jgi:hypothetical protein
MSKLDTYINIDQSLRLRGLSKLSEAQLKLTLENNLELQRLKNQLSSDLQNANDLLYQQNREQQRTYLLQEQILRNQIKEIEHREIQSFNKKRIFQCREYLNDFEKLKDLKVISHFKTIFILHIEHAINESKQKLEEITDKEFCLQLQNKIEKIKGEKTIDNTPLLANLDNISSQIFIETNLNSKLRDNEYALLQNENSLAVNKEEKNKLEIEKVSKEKRTVTITRAVGIIGIILLMGGLQYLLLGFILLMIAIAFEINSHFNKRKINTQNSEINNLLIVAESELKNDLLEVREKINESNNNLEKYRQQYAESYQQLFESHPEFRTVEYILEEEISENPDQTALGDRDSLFEDAARLIVQSQSGSTSLLQRRMKLGYNRAGRLMDQLEAAGVVGPNQGSKVRDVLIKTDAELQQYLNRD